MNADEHLQLPAVIPSTGRHWEPVQKQIDDKIDILRFCRGGSSGDYGLPPSGDFPGGRGGGRGYNAPPSAEKAAYNGGGSAGYEHFGNGSGPRGCASFAQSS